LHQGHGESGGGLTEESYLLDKGKNQEGQIQQIGQGEKRGVVDGSWGKPKKNIIR